MSSNPLAGPLVHALRENRSLRDDIADLRLALSAAIGLVAARDKHIKQLENTKLHLKAQLQAAIGGRTIAAERQQLERERLDAETDARFDRRHERSVA